MRTPVYAIIDLNTRTSARFEIDESMYRKYIGGKILGARLLYDLTPAGVDPLGPDAVVIINTSPANGTGAPCSSRFNMTFKNVLTGGIASSNCGGQFGVLMKRAGYDGIILRGQSETPCVISIVDKQITFSDAGELWGKDTEETQNAFPKIYGKLVIGPAGENLVRYAAAVSGERVAGRCGAGAVLGAKKIKAIVAYGTQRPYVAKPEKFAKYVKKWVSFLRNHPMTGEALPNYGSAGLVSKANATNALPTHNFKYGHFKDAQAVSGETLADKHLVRNSSCIS